MPNAQTLKPAQRLAGLGTNIFSEMTALAAQTGAINLAQGFPDSDGPAAAIEAAVGALQNGQNQYAPIAGVELLREAVRDHQRRNYGLECEDVQVTFGATEAIASAILGLLDPGDEVVLFEPFYDSYAACAQFAGARCRLVTLRPPLFAIDGEALEVAVRAGEGKVKALIINSPNNPTGRVFSRGELEAIARVCVEHDLICISDEVYEHVVYLGEHVPMASLPGMAERTLTISSVAKSYSFTGWKVGWVSGPTQLISAVRGVKQFLSFSGGTPLQIAAAAALTLSDADFAPMVAEFKRNRDVLADAFRSVGWEPIVPDGTYFINADVGADGAELCRTLPTTAGVAALPTSAFYANPGVGTNLVRFAFCKRPEVIDEAAGRIKRLKPTKRSMRGWWSARKARKQARLGLNPPS